MRCLKRSKEKDHETQRDFASSSWHNKKDNCHGYKERRAQVLSTPRPKRLLRIRIKSLRQRRKSKARLIIRRWRHSRGGEVGPLDHLCPLCSAEGDQRLKLRTWDVAPAIISFYCVRCGASGYARATLDQLLHPDRYEAETIGGDRAGEAEDAGESRFVSSSGGSGMRQRRSCRGACPVFPLARHPHRRGTTRGAALSSEVPLARQG